MRTARPPHSRPVLVQADQSLDIPYLQCRVWTHGSEKFYEADNLLPGANLYFGPHRLIGTRPVFVGLLGMLMNLNDVNWFMVRFNPATPLGGDQRQAEKIYVLPFAEKHYFAFDYGVAMDFWVRNDDAVRNLTVGVFVASITMDRQGEPDRRGK